MTETRTCIIAVDGSEDSDYALDWFSKHVYKRGDQVVVVFVTEGHGLLHASKWENAVYSLNRNMMETVSDDEQDQIRSDLLKFANKLMCLGLEGKVRNVKATNPEEGILRAAEEENADMIVVGSRGRGALHRTFLGSVSDHIVHHATCPVVVCKHLHKTDLNICTETVADIHINTSEIKSFTESTRLT